MTIEIKNNIQETEYSKVMYLADLCNYDAYTGDEESTEDYFVLAYEDDMPVGFLSCFAGTVYEVSGVVHPAFRKRGIFTRMLNELRSQIQSDKIIFCGKDKYIGFKECAAHFGATLSYHEYLMQFAGQYTPYESDLDYDREDDEFIFYADDKEIGSCHVYEEGTQATIYDVFVYEEERGKGYGKAIINEVLRVLVKTHQRLLLQVSERNESAFHIYRDCGFEIIESTLYFYGEGTI